MTPGVCDTARLAETLQVLCPSSCSAPAMALLSWAQSAGTLRPLVASFLVPRRTPGGAHVQSRQEGPVSLSSGQPDPSPRPVWGSSGFRPLVLLGWTGLSPATTCGMVLVSDHPMIALSLSLSPLQFCACRCSFPIFEQGCVVLCFFFFFFNFVFGGTSSMSLIFYVGPLVLEFLTSPLTAHLAMRVLIIGFGPGSLA